MNIKLLSIAAIAFIGFSVSANAQSQFAGRYHLLSGYTTGGYFGLFGYGAASISSTGAAFYTAYYPRLRSSGSGRGSITRAGTFSLNNGVRGSAQMYGARVAVGMFRDAYGTGWFGLSKR